MHNKRFLSILLFLAFPPSAFAQRDNIERIEIVGNEVIVTETYLNHIAQKVGDPYDRDDALRDFRALWGTEFLDDLTLDVTDGERGKIVTYKGEESLGAGLKHSWWPYPVSEFVLFDEERRYRYRGE